MQVALEAVLETFGKYRRPAKLLLVQAVGLGTVFERKRMEINDRFALLIKTYLDEAVADGSIAPVNTHIVAHAWMGAIYSVVIQWVYTGEPSKDEIMDYIAAAAAQERRLSGLSHGFHRATIRRDK